MSRSRLALALFGGLLALQPVAVHAQVKAPAVRQPTQAEMQRAADNFRVMVAAFQSDKVPQPVKNVLFVCAYSNSFAKISEGVDKAIAAKKADRTKPEIVLGAMAAVCGFRPPAAVPPKK
jgi:hypothetical protein